MKSLYIFLAAIFMHSFIHSYAQGSHEEHTVWCAHSQISKQLYQQNPEAFEVSRTAMEKKMATWLAYNKEKVHRQKTDYLRIPVVVHVVWSSENPESNISDAQIHSQIEALNRDFRARNDRSVVRPLFQDLIADLKIEFRLASIDPQGNYTTGITRTETKVDAWEVGHDMKKGTKGGKDAWNPLEYLNIWVVSDFDQDIAGYASLLDDLPNSLERDGVVLRHDYMGTTGSSIEPTGRTAVHEVGHWLNLEHTWGPFDAGEESSCLDYDDWVADTPHTQTPNFGCTQEVNQCTDEVPDRPDMTENYMDYSEKTCQGLFTFGQKERVWAMMHTIRSSMLTSPAITDRGNDDVRLVSIVSPTSNDLNCSTIQPVIEFINYGVNPVNLFSLEVDYYVDGTPYYYEWSDFYGVPSWGNTNTADLSQRAYVTLPSVVLTSDKEIHTLRVELKNPNGVKNEYNTEDNVLEVEFEAIPSGRDLAFSEDFQIPVSLPFPPEGWAVFNEDGHPQSGFQRTKGMGYDDGHAVMLRNFEYDNVGSIDELILPPFDFTGSHGSVHLQFYHAYALQKKEDVSDRLSIMVSRDCGATFVSIAELFGDDLITSKPNTDFFLPHEEDWRKTRIDLSELIGDSNHTIIKFRQTRGGGNNLYIDAIEMLSETVGIEPVLSSDAATTVKLYPNPTQSSAKLQLEAEKEGVIQIQIADKMGRIVRQIEQTTHRGTNIYDLNAEGLSAGIYLVSIQDGVEKVVKRMVVWE